MYALVKTYLASIAFLSVDSLGDVSEQLRYAVFGPCGLESIVDILEKLVPVAQRLTNREEGEITLAKLVTVSYFMLTQKSASITCVTGV